MQRANWSSKRDRESFLFFLFPSRLAEFEWLNLDPEFLDTPVLYHFPISAKNLESCTYL